MGGYLQTLIFCLIYLWSQDVAACSSGSSPEFLKCTATLKQKQSTIKPGDMKKACGVIHDWLDCLKDGGCYTEKEKQVTLNEMANYTGTHCGEGKNSTHYSILSPDCSSPSSPKFIGCTSTFKARTATIRPGDAAEGCSAVNSYHNCLKRHGCVAEVHTKKALKSFESKAGIKCDDVKTTTHRSITIRPPTRRPPTIRPPTRRPSSRCGSIFSSKFIGCQSTFKKTIGTEVVTEEKFCRIAHVYADCLERNGCVTDEEKPAVIKKVSGQRGIRCGSNVFGLNSFLVFFILITTITNYF